MEKGFSGKNAGKACKKVIFTDFDAVYDDGSASKDFIVCVFPFLHTFGRPVLR